MTSALGCREEQKGRSRDPANEPQPCVHSGKSVVIKQHFEESYPLCLYAWCMGDFLYGQFHRVPT